MSAAVTHIAYSAVFTPAGGSAWNITDLLDISEGDGGNVTELTTDNSQVINGKFIDSISGKITLQSSSLAHTTDAAAVIGAVGALVVKYAKRSAGKGNVASNYLTVTYASVMLESMARHGGAVGASSLSIEFGAYGTDGSTFKSAAIGA
jgi:hypothetical protein